MQDAAAAGGSSGSQTTGPDTVPQAQPVAKRKREESFAWDNKALSTEREDFCFEEVRSQPAVLDWTSQKAEGAAKK